MDAFVLLEMIEGHLLWQEAKQDDFLEWIAWFTANEMMASGNMQKSMDAKKIKQNLFKTTEEHRQENSEEYKENKVKEATKEKEKLKEIFDIEN